jgi:hypothetical protein
VPLPAQFLLETSRLVAIKDLGFSFRLASLTPIYAWNGANSDLERVGLAAVQNDPSGPHYGIVRRGDLVYFKRCTPIEPSHKLVWIAITVIPTVRDATSSSMT